MTTYEDKNVIIFDGQEKDSKMNKKLNEVSSKKDSTRSSWQLELSSFSLIAQTAEFLWSF